MVLSKKKNRPKPVVLLVLEGWGIAPAHVGNALTEAKPEYITHLLNHYPALALAAAGPAMGVSAPASESGHLLIGGGRPLIAMRELIDKNIAAGAFLKSAPVRSAFKKIRGKRLHLIGLVSASDCDASESHVDMLLQAARQFAPQRVMVHCILDGKDSAPRYGQGAVAALESKLEGLGAIASLSGRLYALDPYRHVARLHKAAAAIAGAQGNIFASAEEAFAATYEKKLFDEEFPPAVIASAGTEEGSIKPGDAVIFWNSEAAGLRPLARMIAAMVPAATYFSLSDYGLENVEPFFRAAEGQSSLGSAIAESSYRQLRVSDSEGFANVSACLNGGREAAFANEERLLIPSSLHESYEEAIGAADEDIAREVIRAIEFQATDFIAATFASLDRLAHEMDIGVAIKGVRALDGVLKKIVTAALQVGGVVAITSSHGLAEQTIMPNEPAGSPHAGSLVPFLLVGKEFAGFSLGHPQPIDGDLSLVPPAGTLADVAPTLLDLLQLPLPADMSGRSLVTLNL